MHGCNDLVLNGKRVLDAGIELLPFGDRRPARDEIETNIVSEDFVVPPGTDEDAVLWRGALFDVMDCGDGVRIEDEATCAFEANGWMACIR